MKTAALVCLRSLEERSLREQDKIRDLRAQDPGAVRAAHTSLMLDVGPDVGRLINILVRSSRAQTIVEVGGGLGYSTIWLAEAALATGGKVISIESSEEKQAEQRAHLALADVDSVVQLVCGDAERVLSALASESVDFALLDHWKEHYVRDFDVLWPKLKTGGLVVADNILETPPKNAPFIHAYVDHLRALPGARTQTVNVGNGLEITVKL